MADERNRKFLRRVQDVECGGERNGLGDGVGSSVSRCHRQSNVNDLPGTGAEVVIVDAGGRRVYERTSHNTTRINLPELADDVSG